MHIIRSVVDNNARRAFQHELLLLLALEFPLFLVEFAPENICHFGRGVFVVLFHEIQVGVHDRPNDRFGRRR